MPSCDVIVIGGGINGLACAARLAQAGRKVTLVEAGATPGGGAGETAFAPGFRAPALAHLTHGLDARMAAALDLGRHGLSFHPPLATTVLAADGQHLLVDGARVSGPVAAADRAAWAALHARLDSFARVLAPFRAMTPPRLSRQGNEWGRLARLGLGVRGLGRDDFRELLRMILINVADVAEDELTDDRLRGLLAFDATLGAWLGPRSPNSLILYLNRLAAGPAPLMPLGGMGALAAAVARAAEAQGVAIRTGARVARIAVEGDRATGVVLSTGEALAAGLVVSAIGPRATFRDLVGPRHLDAGFFTRTGHIRSRGGAAKLHLALAGTPEFRGADLRTRMVIAPSVDAVENAFNPVKYGEVPDRPVMEIVVPTAFDPGIAPAGCHVLSAIVQFAPHAPREGREAAADRLLENALMMIEAQAPGIAGLIRHAEILMPGDIEDRFGMAGGNWHHGELAVEQMLFLRPLPEAAQYAAPLPGLWLAGAGSHPGGGINGTAGWNAAERIIRGVRT